MLNIESPQELQRLAVFPVDTACTKLISSSYGVCVADKATSGLLSKATSLYQSYVAGTCVPDSPDMLDDSVRKKIADWLSEASKITGTCPIWGETKDGKTVGINEDTGEVFVDNVKVNSGEIVLSKFYFGIDNDVDLGNFKVCVYDGVPASWQNWFGVALGKNLNEGSEIDPDYRVKSSDCQVGGTANTGDQQLDRLCCEIDNCIGIKFENKGKYEETFCFNMYGSDLVGMPWPTHPGF